MSKFRDLGAEDPQVDGVALRAREALGSLSLLRHRGRPAESLCKASPVRLRLGRSARRTR